MNCAINLNKPKGISSQQAVTAVKRIFGFRKAGHAGTLDPLATGVLLVCMGEATKIARFISDLDKEYLVEMRLGQKTDTYDAEGEVIGESTDFSLDRETLQRCLAAFSGTIRQKPPMYSAVKLGGKPLYKLARKGITVERPERSVSVSRIELTRFEAPFAELVISCSKGTYIRSICNDIGDLLGVGAHMTALQRTRIGAFSIRESVTIDELHRSFNEYRQGTASQERAQPYLIGIDEALGHMKEFVLSEEEERRVRHGSPVERPGDVLPPEVEYVKLKTESGMLLAVGKRDEGRILIERLLNL